MVESVLVCPELGMDTLEHAVWRAETRRITIEEQRTLAEHTSQHVMRALTANPDVDKDIKAAVNQRLIERLKRG